MITKNKYELIEFMFSEENIIDIEIDDCVSDGQFMGFATGLTEESFKGISFEDLSKLTNLSKKDIDKIIAEQKDSDRGEIGLGGF